MESQHILASAIIVLILIGAIGLLADAVIVYGIFRFRRLRTIPNIFLANWALANLFSTVVLPTIFLALTFAEHEYTCLTFHAVLTLHLATVLFAILLLIDWYTAAYYHRTSEKLRRRYLLVIGSIWSIVLVFFSLTTGLCIAHVHYYSSAILFIFVYVINVLLLIGIQCYRILQKFRSNLISYPNLLKVRLIVLTIITFTYLPGVISTVLLYYDVYDRYDYFSPYLSVILSAFTVLSGSIVTLGVMCWLDNDFRLCVLPKHDGLHARFENEESIIENSNKDEPAISYDNPAHCALPNSNGIAS